MQLLLRYDVWKDIKNCQEKEKRKEKWIFPACAMQLQLIGSAQSRLGHVCVCVFDHFRLSYNFIKEI